MAVDLVETDLLATWLGAGKNPLTTTVEPSRPTKIGTIMFVPSYRALSSDSALSSKDDREMGDGNHGRATNTNCLLQFTWSELSCIYDHHTHHALSDRFFVPKGIRNLQDFASPSWPVGLGSGIGFASWLLLSEIILEAKTSSKLRVGHEILPCYDFPPHHISIGVSPLFSECSEVSQAWNMTFWYNRIYFIIRITNSIKVKIPFQILWCPFQICIRSKSVSFLSIHLPSNIFLNASADNFCKNRVIIISFGLDWTEDMIQW